MKLCEATYETPRRRDRTDTHTCCKLAGHTGQHACPKCGQLWPTGDVEGSGALDLAAIRARTEAATAGPWEADGVEGNLNAPGIRVAEFLSWPEADAQFIAHAREDVPALLAEVERLRGIEDTLAMLWERMADDERLWKAEALVERIRRLALMGGQSDTYIRRQIIAVLEET